MFEVEATAEVFMAAFKSLRKPQRDAVIARMAEDREVVRDLMDLATIAGRRREPRRPFRAYLASKRKRIKKG